MYVLMDVTVMQKIYSIKRESESKFLKKLVQKKKVLSRDTSRIVLCVTHIYTWKRGEYENLFDAYAQ